MGLLCNSVDVMVLRDIRQKRYVKIQPQFELKYGDYYSYQDATLWHSWTDDVNNGINLYSYDIGQLTTTNVSIALPSTEVFHAQEAYAQNYYNGSSQVSYDYDQPLIDYPGEQTISRGVTMSLSGLYMDRDRPWVKYGITWECYGTLNQQERTFLGYAGENNTPVWSAWQTIATTPYYWFHQIEPDVYDGIGPYSESDSLYIPASSLATGELEVGVKETRYLGSLSVANIVTYRRGNYHHA